MVSIAAGPFFPLTKNQNMLALTAPSGSYFKCNEKGGETRRGDGRMRGLHILAMPHIRRKIISDSRADILDL